MKKTTRSTNERHNDYLNYIDSIMKAGITDTQRIQNLLNLSYDVNISKRSIRRFKKELNEIPVKQPCNAVDICRKKREVECIKEKEETVEMPQTTYLNSKPLRVRCPCGKFHDIPTQKNKDIVCAEVGYKFNKKTWKWEKLGGGLWGYPLSIFRR